MKKFKIFGLLSIFGIFVTAGTTAYATKKILENPEKTERDEKGKIILKDFLKKNWKNMILPTTSAALTTGCMAANMKIGAAEISAATASAYALKRAYYKHRDAVAAVFGKEGLARTDKYQAENATKDIEKEESYWLGYGYDMYIKCKPSDLERAEFLLNRRLRQFHTASMADFFEAIHYAPVGKDITIGWGRNELFGDMDDGWLVIDVDYMTGDNDEEIGVIRFDCEPNPEYEENDSQYDDVPWYT